MASPNTIKIRNSQPCRRTTYLGDYTLHVDQSSGKSVNAMVRDRWTPGRQFASRDGKSIYTIARGGNLIKN